MPQGNEDGSITFKAKIELEASKLRSAFEKVKSAGASAFQQLQHDATRAYESVVTEAQKVATTNKDMLKMNGVREYFRSMQSGFRETSNSAELTIDKTKDYAKELENARLEVQKLEERQKYLSKLNFSMLSPEKRDAYTKEREDNAVRIRELRGEIEKYNAALSKLYDEADKADEERRIKILEAQGELAQLIERQKELEKEGMAFGFEEYDNNFQRIQQLKAEVNAYRDSLVGAGKEQERLAKSAEATAFRNLMLRFKGLINLLKQLRSLAMDAKNAIASLTSKVWNLGAALRSPKEFIGKVLPRMPGLFKRASKSAGSTNISVKKLVNTLIKYGLGIRSIFFLYKRIRKAVGEGLGSLSLVDEGTNQSISNLMTALNTLKGSIASAFSPIVNVVAPILTTFINLLATATNYVGMFIAAISGRKTYYKAIGVQQDYAESLRDTAGAAGDASAAMKDYLSGLDEIRKFDSGKDSGSGGGGGASGKDPTAGIDWEESPILENIQNMADKIKAYIKAQDWEGLGEYMARGVNTGLQKLYAVLDWKKIGPKIIPVVDAITETFNSLVDNINWDLMGKTVGRGVNTFVNTANRFLTKIDWNNLGQKFADGINGFVTEVDWLNVGHLLGNKIMALWNTFNGFVNRLDWGLIGNAIGDAINGFFERYNLSTITGSIATFLNGLFTTLLTATRRIHWRDIVKNITDGINTFIREFKWAENGEALEEFLDNLLGALVDTVDDVNWEELGEGIGEFLSKVKWREHLIQVAHIFWTALRGLISGLWQTTEGRVLVLAIAGWFTAAKIMPIANAIATAFTTKSVTQLIGGAVAKAIAGGAAGTAGAAAGAGAEAAGAAGAAGAGAAGGGLSGLLGAVAPFAAAGGILTAFFAGGTIASNKFSKEIIENRKNVEDAADAYEGLSKDINAELTAMEMSGKKTKNNTKLVNYRTQAVKAQSEAETTLKTAQEELAKNEEKLSEKFTQSSIDINGNVEALEAGALGAGDTAGATDRLTRRQKELNKIIEAAEGQYKKATEDIKKLDSATGGVSATTKTAATDIGKSAGSIKTSFKDAFDIDVTGKVTKMVTDAVTTTKNQTSTQMGSKTTKASISKSIIDPFAAVDLNTPMGKKGKAGVNTMVTDAKTQASNKESATKKVGSIFTTNVGAGIKDGAAGIITKVATAMSSVVTKFSEYGSQIEKVGSTTGTNFSNNLYNNIKNTSMPALDYKIEKKLDPANNINKLVATPYWYASGGLFSKANIIGVGEAGREAVLPLENKRTMGIIANAIINGLGNKLSGFTIPKLAQGAVIPANREFLATLGDQRNGNNLEMPESLLRQIVREETAGGNSQYQFTAQINRRTLFDEFIKEAKLRQMQTGRNPLEFA